MSANADSPRRPAARALVTLLGAVWPLLAFGGVLGAARRLPPAPDATAATDVTPADPRRDPGLSLSAPSPALDALFLPQASFQYRRYRAALRDLARAPAAAQAAQWRRDRQGSLYTYRIVRMELTPAALRDALLPDL